MGSELRTLDGRAAARVAWLSRAGQLQMWTWSSLTILSSRSACLRHVRGVPRCPPTLTKWRAKSSWHAAIGKTGSEGSGGDHGGILGSNECPPGGGHEEVLRAGHAGSFLRRNRLWVHGASRPAFPILRRSSGLVIKVSRAFANASAFLTGTNQPFTPFVTTSRQPGTSVVTIESPQAAASSNAFGTPSR